MFILNSFLFQKIKIKKLKSNVIKINCDIDIDKKSQKIEIN